MSFLLALLVQVGPFASSAEKPVSPLPPEILQRRPPPGKQPAPKVTPEAEPPGQIDSCLAEARSNPPAAIDAAEAWRDAAGPGRKAEANRCLGTALGNLDRWEEAETAFLAARDGTPAEAHASRARLGAMAGNAALAAGATDRALAALDTAHGEALAGSDTGLAGDIQLDRARALVALKREGEAAMALDEARTASPQNPEAWLLSATLSRRMGKLAEAQTQIVEAARLLPVDPEIGLEAGVIAVLSGHEDAARKSWQSVLAVAPQSPAATTARSYLEQLGMKGPEKP